MANDNGSQIVTEKLDKSNFPTWKFRITNFLLGKGYWEYIEGDVEEAQRSLKKMRLSHKLEHTKIGIKELEKCCIGYHLALHIQCLDIYKKLYPRRKLGIVW